MKKKRKKCKILIFIFRLYKKKHTYSLSTTNLAIPGKLGHPKILPKNIRNNPFSEIPPITEGDLKKGLYNLIQTGIIPKDMDL